jgi:hypothetical protein
MKTRNSVTLYRKLKDFLAIGDCDRWGRYPHQRKQLNEEYNDSKYDDNNGWWWGLLRWMPVLTKNYRRLTYEEFCNAYNLEMISIE